MRVAVYHDEAIFSLKKSINGKEVHIFVDIFGKEVEAVFDNGKKLDYYDWLKLKPYHHTEKQ